jgi:serine/threonine protein kinase
MTIRKISWDSIYPVLERPKINPGTGVAVIKAKWQKNSVTSQPVLIKMIDEDNAESHQKNFEVEKKMLLQEAQIVESASSLFVANVVQIYGIVEGKLTDRFSDRKLRPLSAGAEAFGIVEELCDTNLYDYFHSSTVPATLVTFSDRLYLLIEVLKSLTDLHANGIIHGDLKPQNILINYAHQPPLLRLCDFGLSVIQENYQQQTDLGHSTLRYTTNYKGSPIYSAPGTFRKAFSKLFLFLFFRNVWNWQFYTAGASFSID